MTVALFGDGTPVSVALGDGTPVLTATPPPLGQIAITTTGATFTPVAQLVAGSTATVTWQDTTGATLATGSAPTITFGTSGTRTVRLRCTDYTALQSINLGFDHNQDFGRDGPGATHDKPAEQVTGITGLAGLTGLVQFMAANTALTGPLDLTGCAALQFVECFNAHVTAITVTGCTSLIRLCLEANRIEQLDLNPVRTTLRDLRAAEQWNGAPGRALDFVPLTGPMTQLWHYCIRDLPTTRSLPHTQLPVLEEFLGWNCGQTTSDSPTSSILRFFDAHGNTLDQASVNRILVALDTLVTTGTGEIHLDGAAAPSGAGLTARSHLIGRGWTVTTS